ncbi:MAG: hypothetical protein JWR73_3034 [Tardiphaga sp.]|nr:hypothetical protein [Tardiphaga sp.]
MPTICDRSFANGARTFSISVVHRGIGFDRVGKHRHQLEADARDLFVLHVDVEARDEFAMRSRRDEHGVADTDQARHRIVRMGGENHVDALDPTRQLAIDIEAIVRQQHDDRCAGRARIIDLLLNVFLANPEFPCRKHPARIGHGGARQRLADDGDLGAAALEHLLRLEDRLLPFVVADVLGEKGKRCLVRDFLDAIRAVGEFPMPDHRVEFQRGHDIDHVLRLGLQRRPAALPAVAAVEQQHLVVATLGAHRANQRRDAIHAAHPPVIACQRNEVIRRQREGIGRAGGDLKVFSKFSIGDVRWDAFRLTDTEIDRRFTELKRHQLRMGIGDVEDRYRAEWVEAQNVVLGQPLLRGGTAQWTEPATDC